MEKVRTVAIIVSLADPPKERRRSTVDMSTTQGVHMLSTFRMVSCDIPATQKVRVNYLITHLDLVACIQPILADQGPDCVDVVTVVDPDLALQMWSYLVGRDWA